MDKDKFSFRLITAYDRDFIREMTFQSIHVEDGTEPPLRDILEEENIKKYYHEYGKETDFGYLLIDCEMDRPVGAIWLRLFDYDNKGWGYVDDDTPELSMAVDSRYRGQGIGTMLMEHLLDNTIEIYPNISLSVDPNNKAYGFYRRYGFVECGESGTSVTMKLSRQPITFDMGKNRFNHRVAAIAIHDNKVLLHKYEGYDFWTLPGGRAELGEASEKSIIREIKEELDEDITVDRLIWVCEYFFNNFGKDFHEIGFYYLVKFNDDSKILKREGEFDVREIDGTILTFKWFDIDGLDVLDTNPSFIKSKVPVISDSIDHFVHRL